MFETDRLPAGWMERLNAMDEVWVPTQFHARVFESGGVQASKLRVLPEPVDVEVPPVCSLLVPLCCCVCMHTCILNALVLSCMYACVCPYNLIMPLCCRVYMHVCFPTTSPNRCRLLRVVTRCSTPPACVPTPCPLPRRGSSSSCPFSSAVCCLCPIIAQAVI